MSTARKLPEPSGDPPGTSSPTTADLRRLDAAGLETLLHRLHPEAAVRSVRVPGPAQTAATGPATMPGLQRPSAEVPEHLPGATATPTTAPSPRSGSTKTP